MTDVPEPHLVGDRDGRGTSERPSPPASAVGRHALGPHVVGLRIVVRYLLPDGRATDVLGLCTSWADGSLTVEREGVGPVTIRLSDVVTGKPVPPRPSVRHRVSLREAEGHGLVLWPAMECVDLGEWVLRHAPAVHPDRARKRANSALVAGDADRPLSYATNEVRNFYAERGQVPMVQVQLGSSYERWFTSLGWRPVPGGDSHFQLASVSQALRAALRSGGPAGPSGPASGGGLLTELDSRCRVEYGDSSADGTVIASGQAALDGDWLGLHGLFVEPSRRREGLGTGVIADLLDWGASLGATTAWLHVETDNGAGLAAYERLGFVTHHTNRYLIG